MLRKCFIWLFVLFFSWYFQGCDAQSVISTVGMFVGSNDQNNAVTFNVENGNNYDITISMIAVRSVVSSGSEYFGIWTNSLPISSSSFLDPAFGWTATVQTLIPLSGYWAMIPCSITIAAAGTIAIAVDSSSYLETPTGLTTEIGFVVDGVTLYTGGNTAWAANPCCELKYNPRSFWGYLVFNPGTNSPSPTPSFASTVQPTRQPTFAPSTSIPTSQPSCQPSDKPTLQPSLQPSSQPTGQPTVQPTRQPSSQPTSRPTHQPSSQPTSQPTRQPTLQPSGSPTRQPTEQPTEQPTRQPTHQPSHLPTVRPTCYPSSQPSCQPSGQPTHQPSGLPSYQPTSQPTRQPTNRPSGLPSSQPTCQPTPQPSALPTEQPSDQPSPQPSSQPSGQPFSCPSSQPSCLPSAAPSGRPSLQPSTQPSTQPSSQPSVSPTNRPTRRPSSQPTARPTSQPTIQPTMQPSCRPASSPTSQPSTEPSGQPSKVPTREPSAAPSLHPVATPTSFPSTAPSCQPSSRPTGQPTNSPSDCPSSIPSSFPSSLPSRLSSAIPSFSQPTPAPSSHFSSSIPTGFASMRPSLFSSTLPSVIPSLPLLLSPTMIPSQQPWTAPTSQPTGQPSTRPSLMPLVSTVTHSRRPSTQCPSSTSSPTFTTSTLGTPIMTTSVSFAPSLSATLLPTAQATVNPTAATTNPSVQPSAAAAKSEYHRMADELLQQSTANRTSSGAVSLSVISSVASSLLRRLVQETISGAANQSQQPTSLSFDVGNVTVTLQLWNALAAVNHSTAVLNGTILLPMTRLPSSSNSLQIGVPSGSSSSSVFAVSVTSYDKAWIAASNHSGSASSPDRLLSDVVSIQVSTINVSGVLVPVVPAFIANLSVDASPITWGDTQTLRHNCTVGHPETVSIVCTHSNLLINLTCSGAATATVRRQCPIPKQVCNVLNLRDLSVIADSSEYCEAVTGEGSSRYLSCRCGFRRTANDPRNKSTLNTAVLSAGGFVNVAVMTEFVAGDFGTTVAIAGAVDSSSFAKDSSVVFIVFGCIWGCGLVVMAIHYSLLLDPTLSSAIFRVKRVEPLTAAGRCDCASFAPCPIHTGCSDAVLLRNDDAITWRDVRSAWSEYIVHCLPSAFHPHVSAWYRLAQALETKHQFIGLFYRAIQSIRHHWWISSTNGAADSEARHRHTKSAKEYVLEVVQFLTLLTWSFFLLAILYDLQFPSDDGSCGLHTTETQCLQRRSLLDPRLSYCQWVSLPLPPSAGVLVEINRQSGVVVQSYDIAEISEVDNVEGQTNHECRFNGSPDSFAAYFVPIVITTMISIPMTLFLDALVHLMAHHGTDRTDRSLSIPHEDAVHPSRHRTSDKGADDYAIQVRPVELLPSPRGLPPQSIAPHPMEDEEGRQVAPGHRCSPIEGFYGSHLPIELVRSRRQLLRVFGAWQQSNRKVKVEGDEWSWQCKDEGEQQGVYAVHSLLSMLLDPLQSDDGVRHAGVVETLGATAMWEWVIRKEFHVVHRLNQTASSHRVRERRRKWLPWKPWTRWERRMPHRWASSQPMLQYLAMAVVAAINLGALYFLALKGVQRGLKWQLSFLLACLVEWSVDTFVMETVEVLWVEYFLPRMIATEVQRAVLTLTGVAIDRLLTEERVVDAPDRHLWYEYRGATELGQAVASQRLERGVCGWRRWEMPWLTWLACLSVEGHRLLMRIVTTCVVGVVVFGWYALRSHEEQWFVVLRVVYVLGVSAVIGVVAAWMVYRHESSRLSFQQLLRWAASGGDVNDDGAMEEAHTGGGKPRESPVRIAIELPVLEAAPRTAEPAELTATEGIVALPADWSRRNSDRSMVEDTLSFEFFAPSEVASRRSTATSLSSPPWLSSSASSASSASATRLSRTRTYSDSIDDDDATVSDDVEDDSSWSSLSL